MAELVDIIMPDSDEEGTEAVLETWLKQVGEFVEKEEPVAEVATDKVTMEVSAPVCGTLEEVLVQAGDNVEGGMLLGRIAHKPGHHEHGAGHKETEPEKIREAKSEIPVKVERTEVRLSPAVRKLLEEHSLNVDLITGSGRGGRVTVKDVRAYLERVDGGGAKPKGPDFREELIKHSQMRLQIADHMIMSALETAPHVTAIFECDMSAVIAHRQRHKADFEKRGSRLTFTSYFVYAVVEACRAVPMVNGQWREEGIQLFDHCNVGVATALGDQGLIVPVVKNAQEMDLFEISATMGELTEKARSKKLSLSDVRDGTISITNYGIGGSLFGTPIINQPQNAIVGIGKMEKRTRVVESNGKDEIVIRPMVYVTLTIDHRAIDGFTANQWLDTFVSTLEVW